MSHNYIEYNKSLVLTGYVSVFINLRQPFCVSSPVQRAVYIIHNTLYIIHNTYNVCKELEILC